MHGKSNTYRRKAIALIQREIDGEIIVLNTVTGHIHQLNPVASCIWRKLADDSDLAALAKTVAEEFAVEDDSALRDAETFVAELTKLELLEEIK